MREYKASLEDLSFNSKPVINTLTILADENKKFAAEVVMLLETRIKEVRLELLSQSLNRSELVHFFMWKNL